MVISVSVADLIAALQDPDYRIGAAALDCITLPCDPSVQSILIGILHERQYASIQNDVKSGVLAWRGVCALGRIGDASVVPYLLAAAEEEFTLLRASVIQSLVQIATRTNDPEIRAVVIRHLIEQQMDHGIVSSFKPWHICDEAAKGISVLLK